MYYRSRRPYCTEIVTDALRMAYLYGLPNAGLIVRSRHGNQYIALMFQGVFQDKTELIDPLFWTRSNGDLYNF